MNNWFLFPLSKLETGISNFSFYSRNPRSEFHISLSTLKIRDQNLVFLFLLSKFETRISNFSFYSRNSRSEFQISLSTLEFTFFDSRQCLEYASADVSAIRMANPSLIKIVIYYFQQECGLMKTEIKVAAASRDSTIQLISWATSFTAMSAQPPYFHPRTRAGRLWRWNNSF